MTRPDSAVVGYVGAKGAMTTLSEFIQGAPNSWPKTERYVEWLFDAVAIRHAHGKGGPCGPNVAKIDGESIALPNAGSAPSDLEAANAAGKAAWETLAAQPWNDSYVDPMGMIRHRWPAFGDAHAVALARALSAKAESPRSVAREWREARSRAESALRPLKLSGRAGDGAMKTGVHPSPIGATLPPNAVTRSAGPVEEPFAEPAPARSWIPTIAIGGLVLLVGCGGLALVAGWIGSGVR